MQDLDVFFVIPTYRLREVGETVECDDEHFWRNGHAVQMIVFDDSSPANQEKYYPLPEQTCTHNSLCYVGPREKEQFLAYLNGRLRDKRQEGLVKNLFRPKSDHRRFVHFLTRWEPVPFGLSGAEQSQRPPALRPACSPTSPLARLRSERTASVFSKCSTLYQCPVVRFSLAAALWHTGRPTTPTQA